MCLCECACVRQGKGKGKSKGKMTDEEICNVYLSYYRSLFFLLDVHDRGAINYTEYLTGLALLNEQGTDKTYVYI